MFIIGRMELRFGFKLLSIGVYKITILCILFELLTTGPPSGTSALRQGPTSTAPLLLSGFPECIERPTLPP